MTRTSRVARLAGACRGNSGRHDIGGDSAGIERAIYHLLANAIKHTPSGGNVGIEVSATSDTVTITVTDSGIGIASDDLPNIFDLYGQGKQLRSGMSRGLAYVKLVAVGHGGNVEVESELNRGSRFSIILPIELKNT